MRNYGLAAYLSTFLVYGISIISGRTSNCISNCVCSSNASAPSLGVGNYILVECTGKLANIGNISNADILFYKTPLDLDIVLDYSVLVDFYKLKSLKIIGNVQDIKSIPTIITLEELQISNSYITFISGYSLYKISKTLVMLSLSHNFISHIGDDAFHQMAYLQHLNLSYNSLTRVPSKSFADLKQLQVLDLSNNLIQNVLTSEFKKLLSLKWVNLEGNVIHTLSFVKFPNSGTSFFVGKNPISNLTWHSTTQTQLNILDISACHLTVIETNTFINASINTIKITNSQRLQLMDANAFVNSKVNGLLLFNNSNLQFIDSQSLQDLESLHTIDVSYTGLRVLPETWMNISTLRNISALGTFLVCDCSFNWIVELTKKYFTGKQIMLSPETQSMCNIDRNLTLQHQTCSPKLIYRSSNLTVVNEGGNVRIRCKVAGKPTPLVHWYFGNRMLLSNSAIGFINGDLVIKQVKSDSAGMYVCSATNNQGPGVRQTFYLEVIKDESKIIIRNIGEEFVEFSWQIIYPSRRYKAILIEVKTNNQTSFPIQYFVRSRHSPTGYTISNLQRDTTYRLCLAYQNQQYADGNKCDTFTTKSNTENTPDGITDYRLYGIIIASIVSALFICIIVCACISSRKYSKRRQSETRQGLRSASTYALMTTSFSQRSGLSSLYDNPGVSITPVSQMSRASSHRKGRRAENLSEVPTPSSAVVYFSPNVMQYDEATGMVTCPLKKTVSDPQLFLSSEKY